MYKSSICLLAMMLSSALFGGSKDLTIDLEGVPLQMEWTDLNGDGHLDLVALMLRTKTEGAMDTWFDEGGLRGVYADQTTREKLLITCLYANGTYGRTHTRELGQTPVLGFALSKTAAGHFLMLWQNEKLERNRWIDHAWTLERELSTPGLLAQEAASLSEFPFWQEDDRGAYWVVPDFSGVRVVDLADERQRLVAYPVTAFESSSTGPAGHRIKLPLPKLLNLDADPRPELTFIDDDHLLGYALAEGGARYDRALDGALADFNGDGLLDLMTGEEGDIKRLKDMATVETKVRTYLATAPMVFSKTPTADQFVPGMVINGDNGDGPQLAPPFLDINGDGRIDLAGIAFKLSIFQAAKVVVTGHMSMKFLLSLSLQNPDGSFRTLAGGPFPMTWKLNLRRLRLPSFAQLAADFDGDGWIDIMLPGDDAIAITPVTAAGIGSKPWKRPLPKALRDPDQLYGRDLNGDGRASLIAVKLTNNHTLVGILEGKP